MRSDRDALLFDVFRRDLDPFGLEALEEKSVSGTDHAQRDAASEADRFSDASVPAARVDARGKPRPQNRPMEFASHRFTRIDRFDLSIDRGPRHV